MNIMYLPPDLSRFNKPSIPFSQTLNSSIFPIQSTDQNTIFRVNSEEFQFSVLDSTFEPDVAIRISRTPLSPNDPSTYAAVSKFVEYNLRKYHSPTGAFHFNQLGNTPLTIPKDLIGVQPDDKTEVLPFGCMINPLISDSFKKVHLTPGCFSTIVDFENVRNIQSLSSSSSSSSNNNNHSNNDNLGIGGKLFGRNKNSFHNSNLSNNSSFDSFKQPKSNIARSTSSFLEKVETGDSYLKKMNNSENFMVSCHGRIINFIILKDNPKEIEIEPPALKLTVSNSVITCFSTFAHVALSGEKNLDILVGFASGDILWLNPLRMKYARWNKNSKLKNKPVISIEWSQCGSFASVGFSDGDVLIFDRDLEDSESYNSTQTVKQEEYLKIFRSLVNSNNNNITSNPISHYKLSNKAISSIKSHPIYHNILAITCDDGYLRIFDILTEKLTDVMPSYYAGILTATFTEDGKYIVSGGEDDIVSIHEVQYPSIFSNNLENGLLKLVARLQGSKSWIRSVQVDKFISQSTLSYIICTAGDDGYIRFYEFQPRSLPRIKKVTKIMNINNNKHSDNTAIKAISSSLVERGTVESVGDGKLKSKNRQIRNRHSGSISSLTSFHANGHPLSLLEIINQGSSSSSLQQSQYQQQEIKMAVSASTSRKLEETSFRNRIFRNKMITKLKWGSGTVLHSTASIKSIPTIYPLCEKDVSLGRLSGIFCEKKYVWAFVGTGDMIRWRRPNL